MAARKSKPRSRRKPSKRKPLWRDRLRHGARLVLKGVGYAFVVQVALVVLFAFVNPPTNIYMLSERWRLGAIKRDWIALEDMSPNMPRAAVAAEDADFCLHWGFDLNAIRAVVTSGDERLRGASTISQQVAKNVFLWQGRSWLRKALEAETTLLVELIWTKRRIIEVYVNIAEFDEGVFGAGAAGPHYFGVKGQDLTLVQASRLAAILPNPKKRSARNPSDFVRRRASAIAEGARTIVADGRDGCFSDPA